MFKITIKNLQNEITHENREATYGEALAWFEREEANGSFGKPERTIEISPAIIGVAGHIEVPAVTETFPAEYTYEIEDITESHAKEITKQELIAKGAKARQVCQNCLDLIAGYNIERELTGPQITQMQSTFGTIEAYLKANRPWSAKPLIEAIEPNELVTAEMKETVLAVLNEV